MLYKTLVSPSFTAITLELQDAFLEGWRIDPENYPVNNLMYSEVHLVKDADEEPPIPQDQLPKKSAGRPPRAKV